MQHFQHKCIQQKSRQWQPTVFFFHLFHTFKCFQSSVRHPQTTSGDVKVRAKCFYLIKFRNR